MSCALGLILLTITLAPRLALAGPDVLSPEGYGLVRFGITVERAEIVLKQRTTKPYEAAGCSYVEFKKYPRVQFMIEEGVVTRADATGDLEKKQRKHTHRNDSGQGQSHASIGQD